MAPSNGLIDRLENIPFYHDPTPQIEKRGVHFAQVSAASIKWKTAAPTFVARASDRVRDAQGSFPAS
jgi:hypothetical protein